MKFFRRGNDAHQDDTDSKVEVQGIPSESAPPDGKRDGSISTAFRFFQMQNTLMVTSLIVFLGLATCGGFLGMGIVTAQQVQDEQFARSAIDLIKKMQNAWNDYVNAAAMIHGRCRGRNFTREDFRELYEYLTAGLDFQAAQFDPNITYAERAEAEAEASAFYAEYYPYYDYQGFIGFETDNSTELTSRSVQDYYFPIHYMEPVEGNERAIGLDYYASGSRRLTVEFCMEEGLPGLTDRLRLVQETEEVSYGVVLMHPGYNLTTNNDVWPHDLASIVIRIPDLLLRSAENQGEESAVYLYDKSDSSGETIFLGAAQILPRPNFESAQLIPIEEIEFDVMKSQNTDFIESDVEAANKIWTVVVVRQPGTFQPDILFVIIGAVLIFLAAMGLATWVYLHMKRIARYNRERVEVEAEKAGLILATAEEAARVERELNDFIAHEVRNPVAAAMAACSFVRKAVNKEPPLRDKATRDCCREDIKIIENALKFVNDLLRNMLDMHRAASKQIKVDLNPVDLLHDVFEPVQAMLSQRGSNVEVLVDCPRNTWVLSDRLRLKQVAMNLGRNSSKFVHEGYIKLSAAEVDGQIEISVSDSGPGIPTEKRAMLFNKFQESLDMLSQGTGIGLFLCKNLVELMGGVMYLDESFDSGVPGCPGTRFVVQLKQPPMESPGDDFERSHHEVFTDSSNPFALYDEEAPSIERELPTHLRVLFVDDDPILRKLFARTIKTVAPSWDIREVSNGETALLLTEKEHFDLIFMDMYMASVEKQLLGTEAVEAMRARGIDSRICGLSANDKEREFLEAGANAFTIKPFPCEPRALTQELLRILYHEEFPEVARVKMSIAFADADANEEKTALRLTVNNLD